MRALISISLTALVSACAHSATAGPSQSSAPHPPFRRVVTGFDASGRSTIAQDGPVPEVHRVQSAPADQLARQPWLRGISGDNPWFFKSVPTNLADTSDALASKAAVSWAEMDGVQPPRGAIGVQLVRYEPGAGVPMHATATIDVIAVISGSMELVLEAGSTVLHAGDVVVQRGTPHAWKVVGQEPCVFIAFLVDASNSPLPPSHLDKYPMPERR